MTVFLGILIVAGMFGAGIAADVWAKRVAARERSFDPAPPVAVHAFMGREPDTSVQGIKGVPDVAIWITDDGELAWCPFIRPSTPVDNAGDGA